MSRVVHKVGCSQPAASCVNILPIPGHNVRLGCRRAAGQFGQNSDELGALSKTPVGIYITFLRSLRYVLLVELDTTAYWKLSREFS